MERVKPNRRTPELTPRLALFGAPLLIEGEDAATYDELLAHMLAAVKPVDVIDEMLIADVAALEWEVLRWRRLKTCRFARADSRRWKLSWITISSTMRTRTSLRTV
jgi:hypothetical protein